MGSAASHAGDCTRSLPTVMAVARLPCWFRFIPTGTQRGMAPRIPQGVIPARARSARLALAV